MISPGLPALAEIERRIEELLAQPVLPSRHANALVDPASRPTAALPAPEPRLRPKKPLHSLRSVFDEYALYGLAGEAVRTLAPHTAAILLQLIAVFGNAIGPSPHCMVDQALEKLRSLGLATCRYVPGRGPFTTLWSAADYQDSEPAEETPGLEEFLWEES